MTETQSQLARATGVESVTEMPYDLIPLGQLSMGRKAVVAAVLGGSDQVHRLHELGLCDGAAVEMVRTGSPCILRLGAQKICFRADDMVSVLVKPGACE